MTNAVNRPISYAFPLILILFFTGFSTLPLGRADEIKEGREEARQSTASLQKAMSDPSKSIPRNLLRKAEAVAVFTNVKKGGFIIGGTGGDGVISRRIGNTWGPPAYYNIAGADVGLQIGVKETDYIMVFNTPAALKDLLNDKMELSAGVSMAAGPIGEEAAARTKLTGNEAVYIYSNSGGAFAGATVGGGTITADNSRNQKIYNMRGADVLTDPSKVNVSKLPVELTTFTKTLAGYAK